RGVRGWSAFVFEGACAHARGGESRRGSAARVRARRDREPSRGALPADSQCRARVARCGEASLGAPIADAVSRSCARGVVRITVELPEADGELVGRAIENAVAAGDAAFGVEFASNPERSADAWRAQQADALVAIMKGYLGGGHGSRSTSAAD